MPFCSVPKDNDTTSFYSISEISILFLVPVTEKFQAGLCLSIKFLNFWTPDNITVIYLKFKQRGQTLKEFHQKGANGITNSEDPDQTAPLGAV